MGEAGPFTVNLTATDGAAEHHETGGVAVVRAAVAVLADGAAKLAHRQDYHVVHAVAEVLVQRGEAAGEFRESIGQLALRATLIDVGIPAADLGKSDFDTDVSLDHLGDLHEGTTKRAVRIHGTVSRRILRRVGGLQHPDGVEGILAVAVKQVAHGAIVHALETARGGGGGATRGKTGDAHPE